MKVRIFPFLLITAGLSILTGCADSLSPDVYTTSGASYVQRVVKGVVVNSRIVKVAPGNEGLGVGSLAGGALGAVAGSEFGGGRGSLAAGIGGALLGGLAGNQIQKGLSTQTGMEYVVKTGKNSFVSVVQAPTPTFNRGQHVLVQYGQGGRPHVIADPDYYAR